MSAQDALLMPYVPGPPDRLLATADVHRRWPGLAEFRDGLGHTPMWEAPVAGGATVVAKCEWTNPAGSIKDRVAYALMLDALREHGDRPPGELQVLAYSGGNLAAGLSFLAQRLKVPLRLVLLSTSSPALLEVLHERGADVRLVDKDKGFLGVIREGQRLAAEDPAWSFLFQHVNPVNVAMHEHTTGHEILDGLGGRQPAAWVASIGSGGTFTGVYRALRGRWPGVQAVAVTPAEAPYGSPAPPNTRPAYDGSGGHGFGIRQPFVKVYDQEITTHRHVSYPEALAGMAEFFDRTGMRIGSSSAANWLVARELAGTLPTDAVVVTVFACAGKQEEWERLGR